ncbi:MAG: hypothetical protein ACYC7D_09165 [Nitrososphaerales archaeon]
MGSTEYSAPLNVEQSAKVPHYWDTKFLILESLIVIIIAAAAYLQYYVYPSIMLGAGFGESNITLVLSFLTFRYDVNRCGLTCPGSRLTGVPALDFVQLFVIVLIILNISHYWGFRKFNPNT